MRHAWLVLVVCAWLSSVGLAREIYVNNRNGNDALDGGLPTSSGLEVGPVRTLAKAMRLARPGDRIHLANTGEPYREAVTMQGGKNSGTHGGLPLIVEGNGAVIEGTRPIADNTWESIGGGVFRTPCYIQSFQVLFLNGEPAARLPLNSASESKPKLEPREYFVWDGYIYFRVEEGRIPQSYEATCAGLTTGLTLYDVRNVIIKDLVIRGFAFDGVNALDNVSDVRLENVVCTENGRSGFSLGGASKLTLDRCEAKFNHTAQLRVEEFADVLVIDCKLDPKAAPATTTEGGRIRFQSSK